MNEENETCSNSERDLLLCILHSSYLISSSLVHILLQPRFTLLSLAIVQSFALFVLCAKVDADTVHTMPLILGVSKSLALEDMPKMSTAVVANNLRPHHAQPRIGSLSDCARDGIPEGGPAAARVELVVRFVEGRVAAGAGVHAGVGVVLVVGAGAGRFSAFLAEDAELLCELLERVRRLERFHVPGDSCACHSPSVFCTG